MKTFIIFFFLLGSAHAEFITLNNLDWLKVNEFTNRSYNDVANNPPEGFRHATEDEVLEMFSPSGFMEYSGANDVIRIFGATSSHSDGHSHSRSTWGMVDGPFVIGVSTLVIEPRADHNNPNSKPEYSGGTSWRANAVDPDYASSSVGHWLIRESHTPEPSGILMALTALSLSMFSRCRKR